jgi:Uncharacterized conserved protein
MTAESFLKRDIEYLEIVIGFCDDIDSLVKTHGSDEEDFCIISLQYSCIFSLIQIGEYIKRVSYETTNKHPSVDWKAASKMRDFVVHNYADVNISNLRSTILNDIPSFKEKCRIVLNDLLSRV